MTTISTQCPQCEKCYHVPASVVGYRCRCSRCGSVWRLSSPYPTEEDILQWLLEAGEDFDAEPDEAASAPVTSCEVPAADPIPADESEPRESAAPAGVVSRIRVPARSAVAAA